MANNDLTALCHNILKTAIDTDMHVMAVLPRRIGKTDLLVEIANEKAAAGQHLLILAPVKAIWEEVKGRMDPTDNVFFASTAEAIRAREFDCILVEEFASVREDALGLIFSAMGDTQKILFSSPKIYDHEEPPLAKKLWDIYPAVKFQAGSLYLEDGLDKVHEAKTYYTDDQYQTELEGNWVAK
jgi:hypothetical protein